MRWHFTDFLVGVEADLVSHVDGQRLVRIDSHKDGACVRLYRKNEDEPNSVFFRSPRC